MLHYEFTNEIEFSDVLLRGIYYKIQMNEIFWFVRPSTGVYRTMLISTPVDGSTNPNNPNMYNQSLILWNVTLRSLYIRIYICLR